jgi:Mg2+-importing ATPase
VGPDIDRLTDDALVELAARTTVFARCTPAHKARIVRALQAGGHTVGFLGDGVNDLPALRAADVGVCPREAADVVRAGADVVLAGRVKDLAAIGDAVAAGRRGGGNIATYLRITLSSNLGNVIAMLVAGLLLPFLPMLPAQVLAQNLFFDAAQLAFAYDRPAPHTLRRPVKLLPGDFLRFIAGFGMLNACADLVIFAVLLGGSVAGDEGTVFHTGWFTENLLTQAVVMLLLRPGGSAAGRGPVRWAACGLAVIGVLLPFTPLGPVLGMGALPLPYFGVLVMVITGYAVVLGWLARRWQR